MTDSLQTSPLSLHDLINAFRQSDGTIENEATGISQKLDIKQHAKIADNLTWLLDQHPSLKKQFEQAIQNGRLEHISFFSLPEGQTNEKGQSPEGSYASETKEMALRVENFMLDRKELAKNADFLVFVLGHEIGHANQRLALHSKNPDNAFYQQSASEQAKMILENIDRARVAEIEAHMNGWDTLVKSYHDRGIKVVPERELQTILLKNPAMKDQFTSPQQIMDQLGGRTSFKRAEDYQFNPDGTLIFNPQNIKKVNEQFFEHNLYANNEVVGHLNAIKKKGQSWLDAIVPGSLFDQLTNNDQYNLNGVQLAYLVRVHKTTLEENSEMLKRMHSNCQKTLAEALRNGKTADLTDAMKDFFDRAYTFEAKKGIAAWNEAVRYNEQHQQPKLSLLELAKNLKLAHVLFDAKGQPKPGLDFNEKGQLSESSNLIDAFKTHLDDINPDYKAQLFAVYITKNYRWIVSSNSQLHIGVDHEALGINKQQIQKMIEVNSSNEWWLNTFDRLDLEYAQPKEKSMPEKSPNVVKALLDSIKPADNVNPHDLAPHVFVASAEQEKQASRDFYEELLNPRRLSGGDLALPSFKSGVGLPPIMIKSDTTGRHAEVSLLPALVSPHSRADVTLLPAFPSKQAPEVVLLSNQVGQVKSPEIFNHQTQANTAQFAENTLSEIVKQDAAKQQEPVVKGVGI